MVEKAEEYLREGGLSEVRVRCQGLSARIEIPKDELKHFFKKYNLDDLVQYFLICWYILGPECQNNNLKTILSPVASFSQSFSPFELTATHFGPETVIFGRPETRTSVIGDLKS